MRRGPASKARLSLDERERFQAIIREGCEQYGIFQRELANGAWNGHVRSPRWVTNLLYAGREIALDDATELYWRLVNHPKAKSWKKSHRGEEDTWRSAAEAPIGKALPPWAFQQLQKPPARFYVLRTEVEPLAEELAAYLTQRVPGLARRLEKPIIAAIRRFIEKRQRIGSGEEKASQSAAWLFAREWRTRTKRLAEDIATGRATVEPKPEGPGDFPMLLAALEWGED